MLANLLTHQAGKLIVDGMTRTGSDDATLDRLTDKSHIADNVEKLMTCAFVLPLQRSVLDIAQLVGIHARNLKMVGELVKLSLLYLALIDHNGIVEVATFDQVGLQQWHDVTYENEGTGRSNLLCVCLHLVECSKLTVDELALERTHGCDTEVFVWQDSDDRTAFVFHLYLMTDDIVVFLCILLLYAHALNLFYVQSS